MNSVMAAIDRHKLSVASVVCALPLVLAVLFSLVFEWQSRRADELRAAEENALMAEPHNIFDDMTPQQTVFEPTEQDCRALRGNYDGAGCAVPRLAR
jgi:hypothetical protein